MTEARLRELQEMHACQAQLGAIMEQLNEPAAYILIVVGMEDIQLSEMNVRLYTQFYEDFATFIRQQWSKYKEAFDNA